MYNLFSETFRIAYGDLCYFRRNLIQVVISSFIGPLLYLVAFGYGMNSGNEGYLAYVIPGIIAITALTAGFQSSSQKILIQRLFFSSFDELILSPMHTTSVILGKSVIGMLKGMIGACIMLGLGILLTDGLHITPILIFSILFCCFTFSLIGVMAGLLAGSTPTLNMISSILILPMTFVCGTLFDTSAFPDWAAQIIWFLPLTHASEIIRESALNEIVVSDYLVSFVVLALFFAVFFIIDYTVIRKKLY